MHQKPSKRAWLDDYSATKLGTVTRPRGALVGALVASCCAPWWWPSEVPRNDGGDVASCYGNSAAYAAIPRNYPRGSYYSKLSTINQWSDEPLTFVPFDNIKHDQIKDINHRWVTTWHPKTPAESPALYQVAAALSTGRDCWEINVLTINDHRAVSGEQSVIIYEWFLMDHIQCAMDPGADIDPLRYIAIAVTQIEGSGPFMASSISPGPHVKTLFLPKWTGPFFLVLYWVAYSH